MFRQFSERFFEETIIRMQKPSNVELQTVPFDQYETPCAKIKKILLDGHFETEQRTKFPNGLLNRRCHFNNVILGLIDVVFLCGCKDLRR